MERSVLNAGSFLGGGDPKYIIFWLRFACPEFSPYIICFFPNSLFTCKVEIQPSQKKFNDEIDKARTKNKLENLIRKLVN